MKERVMKAELIIATYHAGQILLQNCNSFRANNEQRTTNNYNTISSGSCLTDDWRIIKPVCRTFIWGR